MFLLYHVIPIQARLEREKTSVLFTDVFSDYHSPASGRQCICLLPRTRKSSAERERVRSPKSAARSFRYSSMLFPVALSIAPCGSAKHIFTHVEWHMAGWRVELSEEVPGYVWETAETIRGTYSLPTAFKAFRAKL